MTGSEPRTQVDIDHEQRLENEHARRASDLEREDRLREFADFEFEPTAQVKGEEESNDDA